MKGVLPWLVCWACRAGTRDFCPALGALVDPVQNNFFLTIHYFNSFVLITQKTLQAVLLGRLSLTVVQYVSAHDPVRLLSSVYFALRDFLHFHSVFPLWLVIILKKTM